MNKFMKELKRNKYTTVAIFAFILFIILGYALYNFLIPNSGKPVYGNRLEGIEEVKITTSDLKAMDEEMMLVDNVLECSSNVNGRIVNVLVTVKKGVKESTAKKLGANVLGFFSEEQLEYYDFQLFLNSEDDSFEVIGYKNKKGESFVF